MNYHFDKSLGKITQQISRALGINFEKKSLSGGIQVTAEQWTVISMLHFKGTCSQKEIAKTLFMDKVTVTRIAEHLENSEHLTRKTDDNDRRVNLVSLTPKGEELYKKLEICAEATISEALKDYTSKEQEQLYLLLEKIRKNLID